MLWTEFKEMVRGLSQLGINVKQGVLYEGLLTDDAVAELKRYLHLVGVSPCCVSDQKNAEIWRGDIENVGTVYIHMQLNGTNRAGYYNAKVEFIVLAK